jgi:hypothetical protein
MYLTERDVLNLMGWPSREFVNARMRVDAFPRPRVRYRGIGDQWQQEDIDKWRGISQPGLKTETQELLERFTI